MTIDISPEAVERLAASLDRFVNSFSSSVITCEESKTLRALSAAITDYQRGQAYRYIGKNGLAILARDLEDQRDAALDALTASQAETAAAYEAAAIYLENPTHQGIRPAWGRAIRAITPADSKAALDRMIAEAEERGMRKAADKLILVGKDEYTNDFNRGFDRGIEWSRNAILAAIQKGTPHE